MNSKIPMYVLLALLIIPAKILAQQCIPTGLEIANNPSDEDCDRWLGTTYGYQLRSMHPRVLLTPEKLQQAIDRMYGSNAQDPYKKWFSLVKNTEDSGIAVDFVNLALLFKATGDQAYKTKFISRIPQTGTPSLTELYAVDIMFDELPNETKLLIMRRVNSNNDSWYWNSIAESSYNPSSVRWGYHSAYGVSPALAYAGAFAFTDILNNPEVLGNPYNYTRFNISNYIKIVSKELSPQGNFHNIENRIAGNMTYNTALPGSLGGMYDNIGYDTSEEADSIYVLSEFYTLTGENRYSDMLHDMYRATFYQNLQYPYLYSNPSTNIWCHRAGTEWHVIARVWNTQTDWITQPNSATTALNSYLYLDPRMQYYVTQGMDRELCGSPYNGMWWELIYRNDSIPADPPSTNPTAMYFSGPGLVSMREDWSNNATFAVFIAGESFSRRYEDANSFLLHRKVDIIPHAGARIRSNVDNDKHHWYAIRSVSKNTLKIFDPEESFDVNSSGFITALHSGQRLVPSDNLGGQIFSTSISNVNGQYGGGAARSCSGYPFNACERADVIKYEHVPGSYTYTVGDGTAGYTRKIDFFEREFLYLHPDIVVIFDRVQSVNSSYRKAWTIHTVDEPTGTKSPSATGLGMKSYYNMTGLSIYNPKTVTYIDSLLPKQNKIVVRGGDTVLTSGNPLRPGVDIDGSKILESDIPRWLEIFAIGSDVNGNLTICGDAEEGLATTEAINFNGTVQTYVNSAPTSMTSTTLYDKNQEWTDNQWTGYVLRLKGGTSGDVLITGNNRSTLFVSGGYSPSGVWGYSIIRPLANSYKHWKKISRVSTSDMNIDNLVISVPHYFDTENAYGNLYSFAPHTDAKNDGYVKRKDFGQWTLEIYASEPAKLNNFLIVFHLTDPGNEKVQTRLVEGNGVSGAFINNSDFVLFSNTRTPISQAQYTIDGTGSVRNLIFDLKPSVTYSIYDNGAKIQTLVSSSQGTIYFTIELSSSHTITVSETEPQDCLSVGGVCKQSQCASYTQCSSLVGICGAGYCCSGACSIPACRADINGDGCIDVPELTTFVYRWKVSNVDVTLKEIIEAIGLWKKGCQT